MWQLLTDLSLQIARFVYCSDMFPLHFADDSF